MNLSQDRHAMTDLKQLSALTALNSMMAKDWFDICTVDRVAELLGVSCGGSEAYKILHPLHCVAWAKMPQELRDAVPGLIQECIGIAPQYQFKTTQQPVIEVSATTNEPKRGFLRLLSR